MNSVISDFRKVYQNILDAMALPDKQERSRELARIAGEYEKLSRSAQERLGKTRYERLGPPEHSEFRDRLLNLDPEKSGRALRQDIDLALAPYARLLDASGAAIDTSSSGGRSGTIKFSKALTNSKNPFLDAVIMGTPALPTDIWPKWPLKPGDETTPPPPPLNPFRVSVTKPMAPREPSDVAGESLAFQRFLRERGRTELRNFDTWSKVNDLPDTPENRALWANELEAMREIYKRARFESSYCKVGDVAAPGITRVYGLLRLSQELAKENFRDLGRGNEVYQGVDPYPTLPPVDFDTLLRDYAIPLAQSARTFYDLDAIGPSVVSDFYQDRFSGLFNSDTLQASIDAATHLLEHEDFRTYIEEANATGGAPPAAALAWLDSDAGNTARDEVSNILSGLGPAPGSSPTTADIKSIEDFVALLNNYCVPAIKAGYSYRGSATLTLTEPDSIQGTYQIESSLFIFDTQMVHWTLTTDTEFREGLDELVALYESVWNLALRYLGASNIWKEKEDLTLSPYEFKCYAYALARITVDRMPIMNTRSPGPIDMKNAFYHIVDSLNRVRQPKSESVDPSDFWSDTTTLGDHAERDLNTVIRSYAIALDGAISFLPAAALETPDLGAPPVTDLYEQWKQTFEELLSQISERRSQLDTNTLVLKLSPRKGAYGEVRRGRDEADILELPRTHPLRVTRAYHLEQLQEFVYNRLDPRFYLRQHHTLSLRHKGYGIGRNLYSISLLPEEEQSIVMKSFKDTTITLSESSAENIFEETGSETSSDFAQEVASEHQRESSHQSDWSVSATVTGAYPPYVKGTVKSGYSAQSASRNFAKSTNAVTSRLAEKLSAKRKVTVDLKREQTTTVEQHTEINTERTIRNPNKGHTLTFNWFQMTRKYAQELALEDIELVYSSGFFPPVRIYVNGDVIGDIELPGVYENGEYPTDIISPMPADVARYFPPNAVALIVADPYTEIVPLAQATGYLASILYHQKAVDVASQIWDVLGFGEMAPDGLGALAFSRDPSRTERQPGNTVPWMKLYSTQTFDFTDPGHSRHVPADEIKLYDQDGKLVGTVHIPNLDLRYKQSGSLIPGRYIADEGDETDVFAVPRILSMEERIVATNGIFCDVMIGNCTALEDYLERHRDLDLLEKKLDVAKREIDMEWELARNGLVEVPTKLDEPIHDLIEAGDDAFADRLAVEQAQLTEQKKIYDDELEKKRLEQELERLEQQVEMLKKKAEQIGKPIKYTIDAPKDTKVNIDAHVGHHPDTKDKSVDIEVNETIDNGDNNGDDGDGD